MICTHCGNKIFFDRIEYITCCNCSREIWKEIEIHTPEIPQQESHDSRNKKGISARSMAVVTAHRKEIKKRRGRHEGWTGITKWLVEKTGHPMHYQTVERYFQKVG